MTAYEPLMIDNLIVLDFPTEAMTPPVQMWKAAHVIPHAMSCSRQIWYGTREDFADFPSIDRRIVRREGPEAYAFLLSYASGFEDKVYARKHYHEFVASWRSMGRVLPPEKLEACRDLMEGIRKDAQAITPWLDAAYPSSDFCCETEGVAPQKQSDPVLIVGALNRHENLSGPTQEAISATENLSGCCSRQIDCITMTHPDPETLRKLEEAARAIKLSPSEQYEIRSNIRFVPFDDLAREIERAKRVYVAMDMNTDPEADAQIIDAWKNRAGRENALIHMKGNPQKRNASDGLWLEAGLDNYVSPEAAREEEQRRRLVRAEVYQAAQGVFADFAAKRAQGLEPTLETVAQDLALAA